MSRSLSRRKFLGQANCALISSTPILNTLLNLRMAGNAAAQGPALDRKALVCIFLAGGYDSFNVLVPRDGFHSSQYSVARSNLALPLGSLLSLNQASPNDGRLYGVHPSMVEVQRLFNGVKPDGTARPRRLSFLSNVGTLVRPTTIADYNNGYQLPKALFSHSDQIEQWQTSVPQGQTQLSGWAGRAADILHGGYNDPTSISMNISLGGNNVFQTGLNTTQFVLNGSTAFNFTGSENTQGDPANPDLLWVKNDGLTSVLDQTYANMLENTLAQLTRNSVEAVNLFNTAMENAPSVPPPPANNYMAATLRTVARTIAIRAALGQRRQTFFVLFGGWDHHQELLEAQQGMLLLLSQAIGYFVDLLETLNVVNDVIGFTSSDFGRTLRSNGRGTDHAWGGNQMVFGGPVQGGRVFGTFPNLTLDGPDDVGYGGRLLPSTSVDAFFGEMLHWFGVSATDMTTILPNVGNFYNPSTTPKPIGFTV